MVLSHSINWIIHRKFKIDSNLKRQIANELKDDSKNEESYSDKMSFITLFQTVHWMICRQTIICHIYVQQIYVELSYMPCCWYWLKNKPDFNKWRAHNFETNFSIMMIPYTVADRKYEYSASRELPSMTDSLASRKLHDCHIKNTTIKNKYG